MALIRRTLIERLVDWKNRPQRKPLILRGARQVGKTSLVKAFGEKYFDHFIYLNLEWTADRVLFEQNQSVQNVWQMILLKKNRDPGRSSVLLFIDEIQHSARAVNLLRYFYEELPDLPVIAAGSLLDVILEKEDVSFPVGRVEFLYLYPLSFREYLEALGLHLALAQYLKTPFDGFAHSELMGHFHQYVSIGGMPEIVASYASEQNLQTLQKMYHALIMTYIDDVEKYAPGNRPIIRHCLETAPYEVGKRIKFVGFGASKFRSNDVGHSLRILERAMLLFLLYPTTSHEVPLLPNHKKAPKLQFLDVGLVHHVVQTERTSFHFKNLQEVFRGALMEQVVGQEFLSLSEYHQKPLFWVRDKNQASAEVDFLLVHKGLVIPVEVKSGSTGRLRSLHQFIEHSNHRFAVRLYAGELKVTSEKTTVQTPYSLLHLPCFLAGRIHEYIDWALSQTA